ncbi:hypothetical protein A2U01_0031610 [Trifolium medium]|uniref:Uncharacterized protein n=1 Tax=Trifolium medium TaxID=97028 RepID=A0A392PFV5_9FABA|nr:hypothetical protein [Trifolium medium]
MLLGTITLTSSEDSWHWKFDQSEEYSVKSAYLNLTSGGQSVVGRPGEEVSISAKVWKSWAPLKVMVFSW